MKILVLANNDVGLYKFRKELLEKLLEQKKTVCIALPGGDQIVKMMKMGCHFTQVNIERRGKNPFTDIRLLMKYFKLIYREHPDVVLTYTVKPNVYGGIVCRLLRKKYIVNITGLGSAIENGGITAKTINILYKLALKKASCIFFQNDSNMQYMKKYKICNENVRLIPGSGVNLESNAFEAYPSDKEKTSFLFLGRIMKDKGIDEFFEAAININNIFPDTIFRVAGDCEENYIKQIKTLEQKGIISYLGFQTDTHELIKKSSAIVLPSYHEGMSNVLLEAAACGRPILASKISGCLETFDEGRSGLGFEAKNAESLEAGLKAFISLAYEEKKQMGFNSRKKAEKEFDRKIVVEAYLDEIDRALKKEIK